MSKHINIDELLDKNWHNGWQTHKAGQHPDNRIDDRYFRDKSVEQAKQQLKDLMLDIIGEDEEWKKEYSLSIKQDIKSRKNLRIEQRQKLEELFNE